MIHDSTGKKANLYAMIGSNKDDGIMLSGHTDVVPADTRNWTSDPFSLTEKNNKLYAINILFNTFKSHPFNLIKTRTLVILKNLLFI